MNALRADRRHKINLLIAEARERLAFATLGNDDNIIWNQLQAAIEECRRAQAIIKGNDR